MLDSFTFNAITDNIGFISAILLFCLLHIIYMIKIYCMSYIHISCISYIINKYIILIVPLPPLLTYFALTKHSLVYHFNSLFLLLTFLTYVFSNLLRDYN